MAIKTGLEDKPWYYGLILGLVAAGALYYFVGHKRVLEPKRQEIASAREQLTTLQAKIQEGLTAQRQLPQFRAEVQELEVKLDRLLRILPARRNTPDLLRRIRTLAEQGDFDLLSFAPSGLVEQEFFSEYPIAINLQGEYHNLAQFFERVSRFPRIINIDNLKITVPRDRDSQYTLAATFQAKTFIYKEEQPAEPDEEVGP